MTTEDTEVHGGGREKVETAGVAMLTAEVNIAVFAVFQVVA